MDERGIGFMDIILILVLILAIAVFVSLFTNILGPRPPHNGTYPNGTLPPWDTGAECGNGIAEEGENCSNCPQDFSEVECACFAPHTTTPKPGERFYLCEGETVKIDWLELSLGDLKQNEIKVVTPTRSYLKQLKTGERHRVGYWENNTFEDFEIYLDREVQKGLALEVDYPIEALGLPFTIINGETIKIEDTSLELKAEVNDSTSQVTLHLRSGNETISKLIKVGEKVEIGQYSVVYLGSSDAEPILKVVKR